MSAKLARTGSATAVALGTIVAVGVVVRVLVAGESLFADELSSSWIVTSHPLPEVLRIVHSDAEITPPLFFVLSWAASQLGQDPLLLRLPSLVAGVATIGLVFVLARRTVGRGAALAAAAFVALAPFQIYYAGELRSYAVMMALVVVSTIALLRGADGGGRRWWVLYAVAIWGAVLSHYTCVFVLGVQLAWVLWAHPAARRPALVATGAAVAAFLPWITGLRNDLTSPTAEILSGLSPFTPTDVRVALEHWSIGYPYNYIPLRDVPGLVGLVAFAAAALVGLLGLVRSRGAPSRLWLVVALAVATPAGTALASALSTNLFGTRNLAASWPFAAVAAAALLWRAGPRVRVAGVAAAAVGFGLGAVTMLEGSNRRPDYEGAAAMVDRVAAAGDVVIDTTGALSPGPLTGLDAGLEREQVIVRAGSPQQRERPFGFADPVVTREEAVDAAVRLARGRRILIVQSRLPESVEVDQRAQALAGRAQPPAPYRRVANRSFAGFSGAPRVEVWETGGQG